MQLHEMRKEATPYAAIWTLDVIHPLRKECMSYTPCNILDTPCGKDCMPYSFATFFILSSLCIETCSKSFIHVQNLKIDKKNYTEGITYIKLRENQSNFPIKTNN